MASKKPLVLGADGSIQQLQAGDIVDVGAAKQVLGATNNNSGAITVGQPVYVDDSNTVDLANAAAGTSANVIGLVYESSVASGAEAVIITDGIIVSADWTSVIGAESLSAGNTYFLDDTEEGKLTTVAPTVAGSSVVRVGTAISTTELEITINQPIKL